MRMIKRKEGQLALVTLISRANCQLIYQNTIW